MADRCVACNRILETNDAGLVNHKCPDKKDPEDKDKDQELNYSEKLEYAELIRKSSGDN
jgi:phage FluMu protein Com